MRKVKVGFFFCMLLPFVSAAANEKIILLHGLCRSSTSMNKLERSLLERGYDVSNIGYPSREYTIEELSEQIKSVIDVVSEGFDVVHIVAHSMGGIIVRYIQETHPISKLGRVVMLSPPNYGSEVVDFFQNNFIFKWINGPAGCQLGTSEDSLVQQLGKANFEVGVITGDRSINLILSMIIPGDDDGKVSIESAKLVGMKDFKVIHTSHPFIMKNKEVIEHTISFFKHGNFEDLSLQPKVAKKKISVDSLSPLVSPESGSEA